MNWQTGIFSPVAARLIIGATRLLLPLGLFALLPAQAQPAGPHIGYVYPAGGRQGSSFQVVIGGQFLNNATNALVSGEGVQAAFIEFNRPMNQKEFSDLRDQWRTLQDRRRAFFSNRSSTNTWTTADEKLLENIRARLLRDAPNRNAAPALADTIILGIRMATNATACDREIRLAGPNGLSNPLKFCVGQLPEVSQPALKAPNPELDRFLERIGQPARTNAARTPLPVSLPAVVNGQIGPGSVDRFRFHARQGQKIVAAVSARALVPYLADAVPGWFQAAVSILDSRGHELAYDDHFRFHPDPVLCCEIPRDGEYVLQIRDSLYRGREDFVYRIHIGELPFVTGIFPLGGPLGKSTAITLTGWNLPVTNRTIDNFGQLPGIREVQLFEGGNLPNTISFAVDNLPEFLDCDSETPPEQPRHLTLPVIVNGRIAKPGDRNSYCFAGHRGDAIVAEIIARRLDSPLDSTLELADSAGKRLAFNDDFEDKGAGLETHHADSYLRTVLPADGIYFIRVADAQEQGGPEFSYRLRLSTPRPDFALRLVPSSVTFRGGTAPLTAHVLRQDGFTNAILLRLKSAPAGAYLSGGMIPANQDQIRFTLTIPPGRSSGICTFDLEGRAIIDGAEIIRPVVPADDLMQAFAYRHLVPARELRAIVSGFGPAGRGGLKISSETPVQIHPGRKSTVRISGAGPALANRFQFELSEPPDGISVGRVSAMPDGVEIELVAAGDTKPVPAGNLIVNLLAERPGAQANKAQPNARRAPAAVLPAIPFAITSE